MAKARLGEVVDELGRVKARIADLKREEERLRDELVGSGLAEAEGALFRATVSHSDVQQTDWRGIVASLPQTPQLKRTITRHTETAARTTVRVTSRPA